MYWKYLKNSFSATLILGVLKCFSTAPETEEEEREDHFLYLAIVKTTEKENVTHVITDNSYCKTQITSHLTWSIWTAEELIFEQYKQESAPTQKCAWATQLSWFWAAV